MIGVRAGQSHIHATTIHRASTLAMAALRLLGKAIHGKMYSSGDVADVAFGAVYTAVSKPEPAELPCGVLVALRAVAEGNFEERKLLDAGAIQRVIKSLNENPRSLEAWQALAALLGISSSEDRRCREQAIDFGVASTIIAGLRAGGPAALGALNVVEVICEEKVASVALKLAKC